MTRCIIACGLAAAFCCILNLSGSSACAAPPSPDYSLTWSDEFNGNALDWDKWQYKFQGVHRDGYNTSNAVAVADGNMTITTYTENDVHYTAWIATENKFQQRFGYYEARIKFNDSPGMWSAFWLLANTVGSEPFDNPAVTGAEIDIVEHRLVDNAYNNIDNSVFSAVHWDGYHENHMTDSHMTNNLGVGDGFHLFGVEWDDEEYRYYVDGNLAWTCDVGISERTEYIILSSEVDPWEWSGPIPAGGYGSLATSTTKMTVDYVRVYAVPEPPALIDGDANRDGVVSAGDYASVQANFGNIGAAGIPGDANCDGYVSAGDYASVQANFGNVASTQTAPEPCSLGLLSLSCLTLIKRRRR